MMRYALALSLTAILAIAGCPGNQPLDLPLIPGTYPGTLDCTTFAPDNTSTTKTIGVVFVVGRNGILNLYGNDIIVGQTYTSTTGAFTTAETVDDLTVDGDVVTIKLSGTITSTTSQSTFTRTIVLEQVTVQTLSVDDLTFRDEQAGRFRESCVGILHVSQAPGASVAG